MKQIFIIVFFGISCVYSDYNISNINVNDIKNNLPEGVTLPSQLDGIDISSVENGTQIFKEKCIKASGSDSAFEQVTQSGTILMECANKIVNLTALPDEIEKNKPNGNLDIVFKKYCNKRSEAIICVEEFTTSLDACLTQEEREQKLVIVNITKSLLEFICHEDGNQIALFIADKGPECFESKQEELQQCFSETMGKYTNDEPISLENLPTLIIKEENCRDMNAFEECAVAKLETCDESTPANLVQALFKFVRKETPCGKFGKNSNSSDKTKLSLTVLLGTWLMAVFAKIIISSQ